MFITKGHFGHLKLQHYQKTPFEFQSLDNILVEGDGKTELVFFEVAGEKIYRAKPGKDGLIELTLSISGMTANEILQIEGGFKAYLAIAAVFISKQLEAIQATGQKYENLLMACQRH